MPLTSAHPFLCTYHARKETQACAAQKVAQDIAHSLSPRYISYSDLSVALAQTISATAQRHISSRFASSISNLSRTLLQAIAGAENEYISAFGEDAWSEKIATNLSTLRPVKTGEAPRPDPKDLGEYTEDDSDETEDEADDPPVSDPAPDDNTDASQDSDSAEDKNANLNENDNEVRENAENEIENDAQNDAQKKDQHEHDDEPSGEPRQLTSYWDTLRPPSHPVPKREPV